MNYHKILVEGLNFVPYKQNVYIIVPGLVSCRLVQKELNLPRGKPDTEN